MRIAVFGDSVLWGQGLADSNKIATGVRQRLAAAGHDPVDLVSFAHSGADVWNDGETTIDLLNPLPPALVPFDLPPKSTRDLELISGDPAARARIGEIPRDVPYSLREVDRAVDELAGQPVDLILLDAGINDVNVSHIVLPYMSRHALKARSLSIADRVKVLLELAHEAFPAARIVVTGYYAIVSKFTHIERLLRFSAAFLHAAPADWLHHFNVSAHVLTLDAAVAMLDGGHGLASVHPLAAAALLAPLKARMVELSATFAANVHLALQAQVDLFNGTHGTNAKLAIPDIPASHAILTDDPWLWGLADDLAAEDEVAAQRAVLAREISNNPFDHFVWDRASVGHPNVRGARAYVDAIMSALA